ncbi:MAG: photosystem I reaction center subunit XI [Oculatellaceae cyanobacterium Prado106]|jgi:photosystem I subunit 11|nr:photosystem I reaction center subunit XI [Oculatellaceae cyanobacterium Prado106]
MTMDVVKPADDPQIGNLATPINSSGFTKALINNLPAYRAGLSAQRRGLEIGMAHGYLLYGPFTFTGPYRNSGVATIAGLVGAVSLVVILTICLSIYASSKPNKPISTVTTPKTPAELETSEGWSEFASSFLIGGVGGATVAFLLYTVIYSNALDAFGNLV